MISVFENKKTLYIASIYATLVLLTCFFQTMPRFFDFMGGLSPNLMITAVIATAAFTSPKTAGWLGFASGFLLDAMTGRLLGFHAVFLMFLGYFSAVIITILIKRTAISIISLNVVALLIHGFLTYFIFYFIYGDDNAFFAVIYIIIPYVLYSLVFVIPFCNIFARFLSKGDSLREDMFE